MSSSSYASFRCSRHRLYKNRQASRIHCRTAFWLFVTYNRYLYVFFLNMTGCYHLVMKNSTGFRRGRSCVFLLHVHLVFVTKYRRKVFTQRILQELKAIFASVCSDFEAELVEMDSEKDHVHLLVNYPPTIAISRLVNSLKGVSSRLIRKQKHPAIFRALLGNALWSPSYFAGSCGGASLELIRSYIEQQNSPLEEGRLTSRP
jgi:putative transposase